MQYIIAKFWDVCFDDICCEERECCAYFVADSEEFWAVMEFIGLSFETCGIVEFAEVSVGPSWLNPIMYTQNNNNNNNNTQKTMSNEKIIIVAMITVCSP